MRITQNSMNRTQLSGLNTSLSRLQKTQEELTTGKRLNRPSDSPVDTVTAMRLRDQQRTLRSLGDNINDGLARMQSADDALTRSSDMLTRVRTLVVAGINGTNGPAQREAYSQEIGQIREGLVQLANTRYAGSAVFAGTANVEDSFDPISGAYLGNTAPVLRKVTEAASPAGDVDVSVPGSVAFGGGSDLLGNAPTSLLTQIRAHLAAGDQAALGNDLAQLDAAAESMQSVQAQVGARVNRLQNLQELNGRQDDAATITLSKVEDTDFMKAAMDLGVQSNAYQAALSASAKVLQPTLLDFLR